MRCSAPAVVKGAAFTRWLLRRDGMRARPEAPLAGALSAVQVITRAPLRSVDLSSAPSGQLIHDYLSARERGVRSHLYARSVFEIPPPGARLFSGRRFQALRTNVRRARAEGLRCEELPEGDRERVLRELGESRQLLQRTEDRWWVAVGSELEPVGLAMAVVDDTWAMLTVLVAQRYTALYMLHTHITGELQAAGVRYLIVMCRSALVLDPGLLYLQARFGYDVVNLRLNGRVPVPALKTTRPLTSSSPNDTLGDSPAPVNTYTR